MKTRYLALSLSLLLIVPFFVPPVNAQVEQVYVFNGTLQKSTLNNLTDPVNIITAPTGINASALYCPIPTEKQGSLPTSSDVLYFQTATSGTYAKMLGRFRDTHHQHACINNDSIVSEYNPNDSPPYYLINTGSFTIKYKYTLDRLEIYYNNVLQKTYHNASQHLKTTYTINSNTYGTVDSNNVLGSGLGIQIVLPDKIVIGSNMDGGTPANTGQATVYSRVLYITASSCVELNIYWTFPNSNTASFVNASPQFYNNTSSIYLPLRYGSYLVYVNAPSSTSTSCDLISSSVNYDSSSASYTLVKQHFSFPNTSSTNNITKYYNNGQLGVGKFFTAPLYSTGNSFKIINPDNTTTTYTIYNSSSTANFIYLTNLQLFIYDIPNTTVSSTYEIKRPNSTLNITESNIFLVRGTLGTFGFNRSADYFNMCYPVAPSHVLRCLVFPQQYSSTNNTTINNSNVVHLTFSNLAEGVYAWRVVNMYNVNEYFSAYHFKHEGTLNPSLYAGYPTNSTGLFQLLDKEGNVIFQSVISTGSFFINMLDYQTAIKSVNQTWSILHTTTSTQIRLKLTGFSYYDSLNAKIVVYNGSSTTTYDNINLTKTSDYTITRDNTKTYMITVINKDRNNDFVTFRIESDSVAAPSALFIYPVFAFLNDLGTYIFAMHSYYIFLLVALLFLGIDVLMKTYVGSVLGVSFIITASVLGFIPNIHQYFLPVLIILIAVLLQYLRGKI